MSIQQEMVKRFWPRNTMRAAYLRWQAQENRLIEARQRLDRQYLVSHRQAEQVQIKAHQGILRAARSMLDQPLDPPVLMIKDRLQKAFALLGKGYFRRLPSPLDVELAYYAARIEKICRSHRELEARLRLAQAIMTIWGRNPEFCTPHFFRLAYISPESAWLCFHLRQKRLQDHQAIQDYLSNNCQLQK
jgi:hypothetical protein